MPEQDKIGELWRLIGNTPMVRIAYRYQSGPEQHILAKCEQYNMTGSIKDRMALYILQKAYEQGKIRSGDTIVEATSGNTGISFAAIGRALGHPVKILMPDWLSHERRAIIKSYGAEVQLVSREEDGFKGSIKMANAMQYLDHIFLPKQFENRYNVEAHENTTGREIDHQLIKERIRPAAFVAGVGTGGTIMGVGNYLKIGYPDMKVYPVEPAESPTLSMGIKNGNHRIQGISDEFIPAIVQLSKLNKIIQVNDGDAIIMAQRLGKELGLAVGISSGCNFLGAIAAQQLIGSNKAVVTVFPDSNKKYLSTDLFKEEPVKESFLSPDIRLTGYTVLQKAI